MSLNVSVRAEYSCSSALFGRHPSKDSCVNAIRQLDTRDDKQQTWRKRGSREDYDIGLPRTYWSCTLQHFFDLPVSLLM